ncbi:murein DD-endopeptidase MepM/ murein hydrolase activator NlpD [Haloferula luteola]|uniref:Murein DD-endopeptidase MepM/ murein hydrolase activator NlpD n=1 Tax=Haloferula luteola TaxID=595692 RepID=A0A840VI97_9BACT|nr:M23 family metallopeptidase [Haloferula luteola]MBB5353509.1 murein DD-endopeptidase MepM/ murein hydrolase activator NlpD [Haloferula luteola]
MSIRRLHPLSVIVLTLTLALVGWLVFRGPSSHLPEVESLANFQTADAPLFLPEDGQPRFRLHQLSAWDRAALPEAVRFDAPMGAANGALTYNAQPFWEMNEARGGHHTGDDLNGIGGMNTDLGDPVTAVADGRVIYAGEPSPGWGNTVVLAHRLADGKVLQSMYAHMHEITVPLGSLVARDQKIGTVGTSNGYYPAHLHFEMRESDGVDMGAGYSSFPLNRIDPEEAILELRGAPEDRPAAAVLPSALQRDQPWNLIELSPEDAARLGEIMQQKE